MTKELQFNTNVDDFLNIYKMSMDFPEGENKRTSRLLAPTQLPALIKSQKSARTFSSFQQNVPDRTSAAEFDIPRSASDAPQQHNLLHAVSTGQDGGRPTLAASERHLMQMNAFDNERKQPLISKKDSFSSINE